MIKLRQKLNLGSLQRENTFDSESFLKLRSPVQTRYFISAFLSLVLAKYACILLPVRNHP